MYELYDMVKVDEIPDPHRARRPAKRVAQLRAFIESGEKQCKLSGVQYGDVWNTYNGLKQASSREEFHGSVRVIKDRDDIYLVRMG